jgi:Ca2+-binding EF-hand superfamily protein
MFKALDKDTDGFVTKEEAKGTPHDKDFSTLDKDGDGKLSREEHAAAPEHASKASGAGGTADSKEPKK